MAKQEEKMIPVTVCLTSKQIREAYHQLAEAEEEEDWINAPEILKMLAKREDEVAREIKEGKFITLGELQNKLGK
jgi:hypothetical protein